MDAEPVTVELGIKADGTATHTYDVVMQRHARVERRLIGEEGIFKSLDELGDLAAGDDVAKGLSDLVALAGDRIYDVLEVFIPDIMPRWEFMGYGSAEAADAGEYAEHMDASPSIPQIIGALSAAVEVNGLRWVGKLKDFFDPKLIRAELNATAARVLAEQRNRMRTSGDGPSPSSQLPSGEPAPTSTSPSDQTPEQTAVPVGGSAGLSPVSGP